MDLLGHLRRQFAYDAWANREAAGTAAPAADALRLLAHIAAAEWLWLSRLRGEPSPMAVWPELSSSQCREHLVRLEGEWRDYLQALGAADLGREVAYVNSKGEHWSSTVLDILTHVVLHSSYHRGQMALLVRRAGSEPAYTDYIHCMRGRFLE